MFWCLLPLWQCECGHLVCSEHSFQPSANPTQSRTQFQITRGRKDFQNCLNISLTHRLLIAVCQVSTLHKSKFPPERGKTEQILIFIKRKKKTQNLHKMKLKYPSPKLSYSCGICVTLKWVSEELETFWLFVSFKLDRNLRLHIQNKHLCTLNI